MQRYLDSLVSWLKDNPVTLSNHSNDGRVNSIANEDEIIETLRQSPFGRIISNPPIREWYDFSLRTPYGEIFINIKVSDLNNSAADNLSSKKRNGIRLNGTVRPT